MEKKEKEIYVVLWTTSHDTDVDDGVILCHTKDEAVAELKELYSNSLKQVDEPHRYRYLVADSYYVESNDKKHWERAQIIVGYV